MMQNFGLEDLSHVQSRHNLLKYLVRVEMASDWFTRLRALRALLEPAIMDDLKISRNVSVDNPRDYLIFKKFHCKIQDNMTLQ